MLFAMYFDGDLTVNEVAQLFRENGYHVTLDGTGRHIVSRVPRWLQKDHPTTNVRRLPMRVKKVGL